MIINFLFVRFQNPVADIYGAIWIVFQPVLFGLIGTEIDLGQLDVNTVLYGLCVLGIGLVVSLLIKLAVIYRQGCVTDI